MTDKGLGNRVADRMRDIDSFHVMDVLARARALEREGRSIVHMEIGEPDFDSPLGVVEAGIAALRAGRTHYTPALGLPGLREAISGFYRDRYQVEVASERIVVTPGASGALQLALGVLVNPDDEVLMGDPGYPCNRHFVRLFEGVTRAVPVDAASAYQLNGELIDSHWSPRTRVVMLATPANPTGTIVPREELRRIAAMCAARGAHLIVDEIYQGLIYEGEVATTQADNANLFVINSFSKYFGMTGWRVGWMVVPPAFVPVIDRLAQNIFLAASTPAQYAAIAAFSSETVAVLEERRAEFQRRRDFLLPALRELGFGLPVTPQGAFYLYADCARFCDDSYPFTLELLEKAGVAIAPGCDFGRYAAERHVRFAYTTSMVQLKEGVERLRLYLSRR